MKVLCIGESVLEVTCPVNTQVAESAKIRTSEKIECGAGHAGNIAYLLGKWGIETYIASMVGADDKADKIKKELEHVGVKTDFLETSFDKGTGEVVSLINTTTKNNTIIEMPSYNYLKKFMFTIEPNLIIVDGNDYNATMAAFDRNPKVPRIMLATNYNNETLEIAKYVNYLVLNKNLAEQITNLKIDFGNSTTLVNVYNKLKEKYNNVGIVITLGERGCMYSYNSQIKVMPPVHVSLEDPNGAIDTFVGAFAYCFIRSFDLEKAITFATIAASYNVSRLTSRNAIPTLTEVTNYYDSKFSAPTAQVPSGNASAKVVNTPQNYAPNMSTTENEVPNMNTTESTTVNNVNEQNS